MLYHGSFWEKGRFPTLPTQEPDRATTDPPDLGGILGRSILGIKSDLQSFILETKCCCFIQGEGGLIEFWG
jgi:hypothetical protein